MAFPISHPVSTRDCHIIPRAGFDTGYDMEKDIIFYLSYIKSIDIRQQQFTTQ